MRRSTDVTAITFCRQAILDTSFFPQNYIHDRLNLLGVRPRTHSAHKVLAEPKAMVRPIRCSGGLVLWTACVADEQGFNSVMTRGQLPCCRGDAVLTQRRTTSG